MQNFKALSLLGSNKDKVINACRCQSENIKAPCLPVSERKIFEVGLLCSYVPSCEPRGGANFDPKGIICTNLVKVHKEMLQTKYQSSKPSSFREEF